MPSGRARIAAILAVAVIAVSALGLTPAAVTAEEVAPVRVRFGEHPGFSRVVFDWAVPVAYSLRRSDGVVIIAFGQPARADFRSARRPPARQIRNISADSGGDGLVVRLTVAETSRVVEGRDGTKLFFDVFAPDPRAKPGEKFPPAPTAEKAPPVPAEAEPEAEAVAEDHPAPPIPGESAGTTEPPAAEAADAPPEKPAEPTPARDSPPKPAKLAAVPVEPAPPPAAPSEPAPTIAVPPEPELPAAVPTEPAPTVAEPVETPPTAGPDDAVTVRFDWKEPTAAAVFRRAGSLWAVFDRASEQDPAALRAAGRGVLRAVEQAAATKATLLRMRTVAGINPSLRRDGSAWLLDFRKQPMAAETLLDPEIETDPTRGGRVRLAVAGAGEPVTVVDPEVGDRMIVVPVVPIAHGVGRAYDYPEFALLTTAQGIVIVPRIDDLRVRRSKDAVEITSDRGLSVSPVPKAVRDRALLRPADEPSRLLGLDRWQDLPTGAVVDRKRTLFHAAATADGAAKETARIALAEFLLSQGLAPDGFGVTEVIGADRPPVRNEPRFRLLRGATLTMLGRTSEAVAELRDASLDGNDEGRLWRLAAEAGEGALPATAIDVVRQSGAIAYTYPLALRIPLALMLSEAAIVGGDARLARRHLDVLAAEPLDDRQRATLAYLEGRLLEESGAFAEAAALWTTVEEGADRSSRARAALARVELELSQGEITPAQAIDRLERMRFAWRGDEHEFRLLRLLAGLYLDQREYPRGLRTLRQVLTHFPEHPEAPAVTRQMADAFETLFLGGTAENLPPLTAIALFEEFRELTPSGDRGDELIRQLADRLVSVDLLSQAAQVLENQVAHRLQGTDKARVEARLALVRLLDRNPEAALAALSAGQVDELPEPLRQQRRQLTARALTDLGRYDEALALLGDDRSADAELLRADVHWKQHDWRAVGKALGRVIQATGGRAGQPLDEPQARHVLNRAVALSLGGDQNGLRRLNDGFGWAMEATPYRDAFRLIARPSEASTDNLHARVQDNVGDAEGFQSFLAAYRDRLQAGGLSGIN